MQRPPRGASGTSLSASTSRSLNKVKGLSKDTLLVGTSMKLPPISQQDDGEKYLELNAEFQALKAKYASLQKTVEQLRTELRAKKAKSSELEDKFLAEKSRRESDMQELSASFSHEECDDKIEKLKKKLNEKVVRCEELEEEQKQERLVHSAEFLKIRNDHAEAMSIVKRQHHQEMDTLKKKYEAQAAERTKVYNETVAEKDKKIETLKSQIASSLNENSKERQSQIDELMKELQRVSDEAEFVKGALRNLKTTNTECQKCKYYEAKIASVEQELSRKHEMCKELTQICSKMESQLSQQDELMAIWKRVKEDEQRTK